MKEQRSQMSALSQQTNAGLFHAQKLIELIASFKMDSAPSRNDGSIALQVAPEGSQQSIEYAAWQCVKTAWLNWLIEVNEFGASDASLPLSFDALCRQSHVKNPNLVHLINLNLEPSSWVSELLKRVGESGAVSQIAKAKPTDNAFNALNLVDLDNKSELEIIKGVVADFKQHVQDTRSQQQEW